MPTFTVDLVQTINESTTLYVQAHNAEQAEAIAKYIAENGKDPWDRKAIDVTFRSDDVASGPEVVACTETQAEACNTMPEHTEGLWGSATPSARDVDGTNDLPPASDIDGSGDLPKL